MAKLVSNWSRDPSTQCGAVITGNNNEVISIGFNGFARSMPDAPDLYADREEKYSRIIHAEVNALLFAGRLPQFATLYTYPFGPCDRCVVQMLQAGIFNFVAPKPSGERGERWAAHLAKSRKYIDECGGVLKELDYGR